MSTDETDNFLIVTDDDVNGKNKMEIPLEPEGTLRLSTVSHAFDGAIGLKYKNPATDAFRALRIDDEGLIYPPSEGWGIGKTVYYIIYQKKESKRKADDDSSNGVTPKYKKRVEKKCSDLVALGIPYTITEDDLRKYFEAFGEITVAQVKKDYKTGQSKGFGFIRFATYESQLKCLSTRHTIEGRPVTVKIPNSVKSTTSHFATQLTSSDEMGKVFVGRVPESMTESDLRTFFEEYGEIVDIFVPRPFRAFAFLTFGDPEVAQSVCDEDYVINGHSVRVSRPQPQMIKGAKAAMEKQEDYYSGGSASGGHAGATSGYGYGYGYGGSPKPKEDLKDRYADQQQQAQAWQNSGYGYGYGGYPWGYYNPAAYGQGYQPPPPVSKPTSSSEVNVNVSPAALQQAVQQALSNLIPNATGNTGGNSGSYGRPAQGAESTGSWRHPV